MVFRVPKLHPILLSPTGLLVNGTLAGVLSEEEQIGEDLELVVPNATRTTRKRTLSTSRALNRKETAMKFDHLCAMISTYYSRHPRTPGRLVNPCVATLW